MLNWNTQKLDVLKDSANYTCSSSNNSVGLGVRSATYFAVECKSLLTSKFMNTHRAQKTKLFYVLGVCVFWFVVFDYLFSFLINSSPRKCDRFAYGSICQRRLHSSSCFMFRKGITR